MNRSVFPLFIAALFLLLLAACTATGAEVKPTTEAGELFSLSTSTATAPAPTETAAPSATPAPAETATAAPVESEESDDEESAAGEPRYGGPAPTPVSLSSNVAASLGDPDAPVKLVEFTDYQCPYCARYSQDTMPRLISAFVDNGILYYELKDLPLDIHEHATIAAEAARCAGEQEAYWEMHDALFAQQPQWSEAPDVAEALAELADGLGLDVEAFAACVDSGRYTVEVLNNLNEALTLGIEGTPSFFLDGYPIRGAQPYELFEFAIGLAQEGELANAYRRPLPQESGGAFSMGDPDAPVVMIEFTDYQCPFCARYAGETLPQIVEDYVDSGKVYYIFKDFPLTQTHPLAVDAAEAARCAGDQDAYVAMHDMLFDEQETWARAEDAAAMFEEFAGELGLDEATFADCLSSDKYEEAIMANLDEGVSVGINGTPGFFINDEFVNGAQPYSVFQQVLEAQLDGVD